MTNSDKVRALVAVSVREDGKRISMAEVARQMEWSRQEIDSRLRRDTFDADQLHAIAKICGAEYVSEFRLPDGTKI